MANFQSVLHKSQRFEPTPATIDNAILEGMIDYQKLCTEAAVIGCPDEITGESITAFVVLKRESPQETKALIFIQQLREWVGHKIAAIAKPKDIRFGDNLTKTRSCKIMRRLLRSIAKGEVLTQDGSTLENPAIIEQLRLSFTEKL